MRSDIWTSTGLQLDPTSVSVSVSFLNSSQACAAFPGPASAGNKAALTPRFDARREARDICFSSSPGLGELLEICVSNVGMGTPATGREQLIWPTTIS